MTAGERGLMPSLLRQIPYRTVLAHLLAVMWDEVLVEALGS
jgi:hypothetical protein